MMSANKASWVVTLAGMLLAWTADAQDATDRAPDAADSPEPAKIAVAASGTSLAVPERGTASERPRNLFAPHSWYTPPPPPPRRAAPPPAPAEPSAPPLPFQYLGSMERGGATVYFLTRGDRTYDVKVGDVLDNTYKVDGVSNGRLMFTYLPLATSQGLQIGEPQ